MKWFTGLLVAVTMACGGSPTEPSDTSRVPTVVTLLAAGDIAWCDDLRAAEKTAHILDSNPGIVLALGDLAYMVGSSQQFQDCYTPTWGRHRNRIRPAPGNHDYGTPGAAPYYAYFGERAGPAGDGFYSFIAGTWRLISLNSNVPMGPGSAQHAWLERELQQPARCTLAYWHHPLMSSGPNGDHPQTKPLWDLLYSAGVEVVLVAHDHIYERYLPQDPDGRPDATRGIRQFVVGTGGADLYGIMSRRPNSAAIHVGYGVLKLVLSDNSYEWQFLPVEGTAFSDVGGDACH